LIRRLFEQGTEASCRVADNLLDRLDADNLSETVELIDHLDEFTHAYITCALWEQSEMDSDRSLSETYDIRNIALPTLRKMVEDCEEFQERLSELIKLGPEPRDWSREEQAGHDFWLTRNRTGAGFWDGDWDTEEKPDLGKQLTEIAHEYGEAYLYIGDDGRIWD